MVRGQYSLTDIEYFLDAKFKATCCKMDMCDGRTMGIIKMLCTCALCDIKVKGSKWGCGEQSGVDAAGVRRKGRVNVIKVHCLEFSKN